MRDGTSTILTSAAHGIGEDKEKSAVDQERRGAENDLNRAHKSMAKAETQLAAAARDSGRAENAIAGPTSSYHPAVEGNGTRPTPRPSRRPRMKIA